MSGTIAQMKAILMADTKGFAAPMLDAYKQLIATEKAAKSTGAQLDIFSRGFLGLSRSVVRNTADLGSFVKGVQAAGKSISSVGQSVKSFGGSVSSVGQSLSLGLTAPIVGVGAAAVSMAGQLEQSKVAFGTLLGSAEQAGTYIKELQTFSANTPFEFRGVQEGAQKLMAYGFAAKDVIPMLTAMGDNLSAFGKISDDSMQRAVRAFGQMKSTGTIMKEDLNQLTDVGINTSQILQEKLGLTAQQVANIGTLHLDSQKVINALMEGMAEKFGGSMDKQSKTLLGLFSTFKDNVNLTLADIGETIVKTFDLKAKLTVATQWMEDIKKWFTGLDIGAKQTAIGIAMFLASLGPAMMVLGPIITALGGLVTTLGFLLSPMGLVTAAIGVFVVAMGNAIYQNENLTKSWMDAWPKIKETFGLAWDGMKMVFQAAKDAIEGDWESFHTNMDGGMAKLSEALKKAWGAVWPSIKATAAEAMRDIVKMVIDTAASIPGEIYKATKGLIAGASLRGLQGMIEFGATATESGVGIGDILKLLGTTFGFADGGKVSGAGTGTSDSILAWLSDGEFVVNAKQTAKNRPMLEAVNAGAFANGGGVSKGGGGGAGWGDALTGRGKDDASRIWAEMAAARAEMAQMLGMIQKQETWQRLVDGGLLEGNSEASASADEMANWLKDIQKPGQDYFAQLEQLAGGTGDASGALADMVEGLNKVTESVSQLDTPTAKAAANTAAAVDEHKAQLDALRAGSVAGSFQSVSDFSNYDSQDPIRNETIANTFADQLKGILGSWSADVSEMFGGGAAGANANKEFERRNRDIWKGQGTFVDYQQIAARQEGELRAMKAMADAVEAKRLGINVIDMRSARDREAWNAKLGTAMGSMTDSFFMDSFSVLAHRQTVDRSTQEMEETVPRVSDFRRVIQSSGAGAGAALDGLGVTFTAGTSSVGQAGAQMASNLILGGQHFASAAESSAFIAQGAVASSLSSWGLMSQLEQQIMLSQNKLLTAFSGIPNVSGGSVMGDIPSLFSDLISLTGGSIQDNQTENDPYKPVLVNGQPVGGMPSPWGGMPTVNGGNSSGGNITVNVDGQKLFSVMQGQGSAYNGNNINYIG